MKQLTIGRQPDNDIVLDEEKVSRHHCRCYEDNGKYFIEDNKSLNGVMVDGEKISMSVQLKSASQVVIGKTTFTGKTLIDRLNRLPDPLPLQSEQMEQRYNQLIDRYNNNIRLLLDSVRIDHKPFTPVFSSDDEKVVYLTDEYAGKMHEAIVMLGLISKTSRQDAIAFRDDLDTLADLCKQAKGVHKERCMDVRERIFDKVIQLQKETVRAVTEAFRQLTDYYQSVFASFYETSLAEEKKWDTIDNKRIIALPCMIYGYTDMEFPLFEDSLRLQYLHFLPLLNNKNVLIRYNNATSQTAQDVVNGLLGRLLAGSQSGNVQICVFDSKELGGTSNMLKLLDKHVYTICARSSDMQSQLSMLDRYVENVVQNMLQGPYTSLAFYNKGKAKQEPYQIVVFKDFPYGVTPEMAHTVQRIITNGIRAGVHFVFMVNEDILRKSEDCTKIGNIMHLDDAEAVQATEINLTKPVDNVREHNMYAVLNDNKLHDIVQYVNSGFEIKEEEVLRLTDYMIPKSEWWTRQSANRADIPFGMATNKQIQKLNITQESGQNSAIVIGIPGAGKSVFLHVIIADAMINYSPRELQMYLLDFSGVEFDVYARHHLPHARVIAPEAEREFGLSILREVFEEGNRRMALCRDKGVTNIVELKRKNPDLIVPRLLVIIDEFQKLFEIENDVISREANDKIHAIIQEYRKFGINLILATQKLPAKSLVPYDLIANRVVFKSDPNDFSNLIHWSHSAPQPLLRTGNCVYNNESGAEVANYLTRSFYTNASGDLENILDEVKQFADEHPEMNDSHKLRTFRSAEQPEFEKRILSDRHREHLQVPREVGVYVGESIAIAPCHVYVPLTKDSNNNILIIGGQPDVAKSIAYYSLLAEVLVHAEKSCNVMLMNFMPEDDPMQDAFKSSLFAAVSGYSHIQHAKTSEEITKFLRFVKDRVIDPRKNDPSLPVNHTFINIFDFQRGRMFVGTGSRGDKQTECSQLLEYIMKNGPMVGVFTVLQVDNLANLNRLGYGAQNLFCHRIALQMSEPDSDKIVGNSSANKLLVLNRPATKYRGLYYNHINNSITKFKPYRYGSISKK